MATRAILAATLSLGLLSPAVVGAQEAETEPVLLARIHSRNREAKVGKLTSTQKARVTAGIEVPSLGLWSLKEMATRLTFQPPTEGDDAPAPRRTYVLPARTERASLITPLPRNLPPTMLTHGRVRGPFTQVFPRRW